MENLISLIQQGESAKVTELIERELRKKTLATINENKSNVMAQVYSEEEDTTENE